MFIKMILITNHVKSYVHFTTKYPKKLGHLTFGVKFFFLGGEFIKSNFNKCLNHLMRLLPVANS